MINIPANFLIMQNYLENKTKSLTNKVFVQFSPIDFSVLNSLIGKHASFLPNELQKNNPNLSQTEISSILQDEIYYNLYLTNFEKIKKTIKNQYTDFLNSLSFLELFAPCQFEYFSSCKQKNHSQTIIENNSNLNNEMEFYNAEYQTDLKKRINLSFKTYQNASLEMDLQILSAFIGVQQSKFQSKFDKYYNFPKYSEIFTGVLTKSLTETGFKFHEIILRNAFLAHIDIIEQLSCEIESKYNLPIFYSLNFLSKNKKKIFDIMKKILEKSFRQKQTSFIDLFTSEIKEKLKGFEVDIHKIIIETSSDFKITNGSNQHGSKSIKENLIAIYGYFDANFAIIINPIDEKSFKNYFIYREIRKEYHCQIEKMFDQHLKGLIKLNNDNSIMMKEEIKAFCQYYSSKNKFDFSMLKQLDQQNISALILKIILTKFSNFFHLKIQTKFYKEDKIKEFVNFFDFLKVFNLSLHVKDIIEKIKVAFSQNLYYWLENGLAILDQNNLTINDPLLKSVENNKNKISFELFVLFFGFNELFSNNSNFEEIDKIIINYIESKSPFFPKFIDYFFQNDFFWINFEIQHIFEELLFENILKKAKQVKNYELKMLEKESFDDFCVSKESTLKFDLEKISSPLETNSLNIILTFSGFLSEETKKKELWQKVVDEFSNFDVFSINWESSSNSKIADQAKKHLSSFIADYKKEGTSNGFWGNLASGISKAVEIANNNPFAQAYSNALKTGKLMAEFCISTSCFDYQIKNIVSFSLGTVLSFEFALTLAKQKAHFFVDDYVLFGSCLDTQIFLKNVHFLIGLKNCFVKKKLFVFFSRNDHILGIVFKTANISQVALGFTGVSSADVAKYLRQNDSNFANFSEQEMKKYIKNKFKCIDCTSIVNGHAHYRDVNDFLLYREDFGRHRQWKLDRTIKN